jgi:hypothetical protein
MLPTFATAPERAKMVTRRLSFCQRGRYISAPALALILSSYALDKEDAMPKSKKNEKAPRSVKVEDLTPQQNPKGGFLSGTETMTSSQTKKLTETATAQGSKVG